MYHSRRRRESCYVWWRDFGNGQQSGQGLGCTSFASMCRTPWSLWRKKYPPPVMPPLWHAGTVGFPERLPYQHTPVWNIPVHSGIREEAPQYVCKKFIGSHGGVIPIIWPTTHQCDSVQIPWLHTHVHVQRLSGGIGQP